MVKDRLGHDGALACWCWKRFRSSRISHKFAGPGLYVVSRKRYLASDQHILAKIFWIWTLSYQSFEFYMNSFPIWLEKVAVLFSHRIHIYPVSLIIGSGEPHWQGVKTLHFCAQVLHVLRVHGLNVVVSHPFWIARTVTKGAKIRLGWLGL